MKSLFVIGLAVTAAACSTSRASLTDPSPVFSDRTSLVHMQASAPFYDSFPPSLITYVNIGTVIIQNKSGHDQSFTFVVKQITDPKDATGASQIIRGRASQLIPKDKSAELDVIFDELCGVNYTRVIYESAADPDGRLYTDAIAVASVKNCGTPDTPAIDVPPSNGGPPEPPPIEHHYDPCLVQFNSPNCDPNSPLAPKGSTE